MTPAPPRWATPPPGAPHDAVTHLLRAVLSSVVRITVGTVIAVPLLLWPWLYFNQEAMLFPGATLEPGQAEAVDRAFPRVEPLQFTTPQGVTVRGWFLPPPGSGPAPLLIYFGGNAEEVSHMLWAFAEQPASREWGVALVNYRGFGNSGGEPGEAAMTADARQLFDTMTRHPRVDPARVVAMGRSLGSGVAVALTATRPVAGAVLVTPYDSIRAVAEEVYPYVPVGTLLRHPFDALALARGVIAPALVLLAAEDRVIPPHHGAALARGWGGAVEVARFPGVNHDTISLTAGYWPAIHAFLDRVAHPPPE